MKTLHMTNQIDFSVQAFCFGHNCLLVIRGVFLNILFFCQSFLSHPIFNLFIIIQAIKGMKMTNTASILKSGFEFLFKAVAYVAKLARDNPVQGQQNLQPYFPPWFNSQKSLMKTVSFEICFPFTLFRTPFIVFMLHRT